MLGERGAKRASPSPQLSAPVCQGVLPGDIHAPHIRLPAVCGGPHVWALLPSAAAPHRPGSLRLPVLLHGCKTVMVQHKVVNTYATTCLSFRVFLAQMVLGCVQGRTQDTREITYGTTVRQ